MKYIEVGELVIPKHCKYGPRPAKGLVFSDREWFEITDLLVRDQREKEIAASQRAKEEKKKEISFKMTCNWSNTLASIKTLGNQKRLEISEKVKQHKIDKYHEILKNWQEERSEIIKQVKNQLYKSKDTSKTIESAILLSSVLKERQNQIANNCLKILGKEKDIELAKRFLEESEQFKRELEQEKINDKMKKKIQKQYLDEQISYKKEKMKGESEEMAKQKQDLINMWKELRKVEECNSLEKKYLRDLSAPYIKRREKELKLEQEEEDEINRIIINYNRKLEKARREREEKLLKEKIEERMKKGEILLEILAEARKKEEARIEAACKEKEKEAEMELENKERLRKEMVAGLLEFKRRAEHRKARENYEGKELHKWELMLAYKSAEKTAELRQAEHKKKKSQQLEMRCIYDEQIREMKKREAEEIRARQAALEDVSGDRDALLQFCKDSVDFVKDRDMPPYPVLAAVAKVKKSSGLWVKEQSEHAENKEDCSKSPNKQGRLENGCYCFKC